MPITTFVGQKVRFIIAITDGSQMKWTEREGKLKDADAYGVEIAVTEANGKKTNYYVSWHLLHGLREV